MANAVRIITGQTTFTGGADQIIPTATLAGVQPLDVSVKAHSGNAAACYVGPAGVTAATGFELAAGQGLSFSDYAEGGDFFVIGTATQKISWVVTVTED